MNNSDEFQINHDKTRVDNCLYCNQHLDKFWVGHRSFGQQLISNKKFCNKDHYYKYRRYHSFFYRKLNKQVKYIRKLIRNTEMFEKVLDNYHEREKLLGNKKLL